MLELKPNSRELAAEIDEKETKVNNTKAQIVFKNTSYIKVVTASDTARGNRANLLLLDEFRMISKDVIDTILRKFLTQRRMPMYQKLTKEQRIAEYDKEKNKTMYLSSAYFVDHWSYLKCTDTCKFMIDDTKHQFVCGLPYQLSIKEGLLDSETVEDEMAETDFNEVKFGMEYEALWWGSSDGAFFDFASISKNRKIKYANVPDSMLDKFPGASFKIPPKQNGEVRILSADIALMSSRKNDNDATAIFINQLTPTKAGRYVSNIIYTRTDEGMRTDDQAFVIRKMFDEFQCDYIVLDCNGLGIGVFDSLSRDIPDPETGEIYPAISCCNNAEMAARCPVQNAAKVIWAIKANAQFNSDCAFLLREGFRSGRIRLLISEYDADELFSESVRGYDTMTPAEKISMQLPYIQTTLLIDELVKLEHEESGGKVKISERSGMRKDRYSSLSYNYYVATQIENKLAKRQVSSEQEDELFIIRAPARTGRR